MQNRNYVDKRGVQIILNSAEPVLTASGIMLE